MNDGGSIVEFFYNIVPGALFFFILQYFGIIDINLLNIHNDSVIIIFVFLILGLFLGFLFQAITIFFRHKLQWNNINFKKIKDENPVYKLVYNTFPQKALKMKSTSYDNLFYLMDTRLRAEKRAFLPTHFSSLFAFWSNIFLADLVLLFIFVVKDYYYPILKPEKNYVLIFLYFFIPASWLLADKFLKSFYDTILNCYYMSFVKDKRHNK